MAKELDYKKEYVVRPLRDFGGQKAEEAKKKTALRIPVIKR
jgi:hypothetical protein